MNIINATINTVTQGKIENGYIKTKGKKIVEIGEMSNYIETNSESIVDLKGNIIYPGFIDAHTHLGMWEDSLGFEGDDGNEDTDPISPNLRAIDAINPIDKCFDEGIKAGVTSAITGPGSANPIAGQMVAIKLYGKRIDDMIIKSPVAMKMALGENPKSTYHEKEQTPTTRMATASLIREELKKAIRYEQQLSKAKENEDVDLPEYDAKLEALVPVVLGKLPVHFHAHRADDIFTAIRIAKEFNLEYVIVHATDAGTIIEELKQENPKLLIGPVLTDRSKPELSNLDIKTANKLSESNFKTAIITDHPVIPIQYLTLCAALSIKGGLTPEKAIENITINPAQICGIADRVGSIEVGKDADFAVFNDNPFNIQSKLIMTIIDGKIIYKA